jgi:AAA domain, putative AbiEii toxin, Type IV TA system
MSLPLKSSSPKIGSPSHFFFVVGRTFLSLFLPGLRGLSEEEVASEPEYRSALVGAGMAPIYLVAGLLSIGFGWRSGPVWWSGIAATGVGLLVMGTAVLRLTVALQVRSRATSQADTKRAADPTFRDVERIRSERDSLEERLFQRNLKDEFDLKAFDWQEVSFFEDGGYRFAPRVNVLLGKNGYGKTLLFRSLVAMVQRDLEHSAMLLANPTRSDSSQSLRSHPQLKVEVTRNGNTEGIIRDATYFDDSKTPPVGKIPLLAIPDSRFLTRTRRTVAGAVSTSEPLSSSGARSYLTQEPFENVVQDLLTQLCIDYLEPVGRPIRRMKGFDRQIFQLVQEVVGELTEDHEFRFSEIKRTGTSGFEILVHTSGSQGVAIPIQSASQGTLSVVAIFGLIYSFLHSLRPDLSEDKVSTVSASVLIDEIDAHLHPSWQQKITGMLTRKFPNVQFIVSAHSPAIVAGCDKGEVSVLRRRPETGKFYVETLPEDFLGASVPDLYKRVFEIEDVDRLYLEYTAKGSIGQDEREREIERLDKKQRRSAQEEELLDRLLRESRLVDRAEAARDQAQFAMLDGEVERLRHSLREKEREIEQLKENARKTAGGEANVA